MSGLALRSLKGGLQIDKYVDNENKVRKRKQRETKTIIISTMANNI